MSMTTTDPAYKYAFAYGVATHCLTVIAECIDRAKRDGKPIDPNDSELNWAIQNFKIADDNLHAEPKKETA